MTLNKIDPKNISKGAIKLIGSDWILIAAGDLEKNNMMTASWGGLGVLWNKPVAYIFVRPSRYTYQFLENRKSFSLNFFDEQYREVLRFCGTHSGRDVNKLEETELTAKEEQGTIYFQEAKLILLCKKIYYQDLLPNNFLNSDIKKQYPNKNYHRMYVGEIEICYQK